jgi:hypothetical protein
MARGLPVVTTPLGAEGLGDGVLVGADADTFAAHVAALLGDDALWQERSAAGLDAVEARFSRRGAAGVLGRLLPGQPSRKA